MSVAVARMLRRRLSPPEARLWNVLRSETFRPYHFRRQVPIGPYYADFASHRAKLVIEVDGGRHSTDEAIAHDAGRDAFLRTQGFHVLRVSTIEVLGHLDGVVAAILAAVAADG